MINKYLGIIILITTFTACSIPKLVTKNENKNTPGSYGSSTDTTNVANIDWKIYFSDPNLTALIDTALVNNQELNITMQEIEIAKNEVSARKGEYLPFVSIGGGAGLDKVSRYTSKGASDDITEIRPGKETPEILGDFKLGIFASWEVDIWHKLRNAKKSAYLKYLSSTEGRNFLVTNLVAEISKTYYELLALDNQLELVRQNIVIQSNALATIRIQKQAASVTELAVKRFEALVLNTRSLQFGIQQQIIEAENKINFLLGRYPQPILRSSAAFMNTLPPQISAGIPSQLLENRPDIRQAALQLEASKIDISVARANFLPSFRLTSQAGLQGFNPSYFVRAPSAILYSLAGEMMGPVINRRAIKATYFNANAKQIQSVYNYERSILNGYLEVKNQLSNIDNIKSALDLKKEQVIALTESVDISNDLFLSARADYMEVLLTQRDALESRFDLIDIKLRQMQAFVNVYRALGGGWN